MRMWQLFCIEAVDCEALRLLYFIDPEAGVFQMVKEEIN